MKKYIVPELEVVIMEKYDSVLLASGDDVENFGSLGDWVKPSQP